MILGFKTVVSGLLFLCSFFSFGMSAQVLPGAHQTAEYIPLLKGKKVGVVVNHTSLVNQTHLVDTLIKSGVNVTTIFCPEHGFRGDADAGALISDSYDKRTGIPVVSLYGKQKKPSAMQLGNSNIIVFDLQDVGVRFYTYISTLFYVMQACAENNIPLIVLDRPNPNGDYVAGPVLEKEFTSFVGIVPIPLVYGMTIGELGGMMQGEGWLGEGLQCDFRLIRIANWNHSTRYELPVPPSPNLPDYQSVRLYPSLCLFEGTALSVGRGTTFPFKVAGYPQKAFGDFQFIPTAIKGMDSNPKHKGLTCFGLDLRTVEPPLFTLKYLMQMHEKAIDKKVFWERPQWINLLMGRSDLIEQIEAGLTEEEIVATWQKELNAFKENRSRYLLYGE